MDIRKSVWTIGMVAIVLAILVSPVWSRNNEVQAQGQYYVFLPAVLNAASPDQPTVPLPEPSPTPLPEREINLSLNLREQEGVTILNDRPDWDGRANGLVSSITVNGTAEFLFQVWGPPGKWDTVEAEKTVTLDKGTYNLSEWEEGKWNDCLQKVIVPPGTAVVLFENDSDGSGIIIVIGTTPISQEEERELDLSNIKKEQGVIIINDRSDWDERANNLVSSITVEGTATFLFQRWGPPGVWNEIQEEKLVTLNGGTYNLSEWEEGKWNDCLQKVIVPPGTAVVLFENSNATGIGIAITN